MNLSNDASGMRALKKGKYGTVQYVGDNYTVRNKDLISKHVFAGNTRLVSKTVMQEEKSGKMTVTEQGAYYYHADHLGSSSVVTDKDGKFYEQIEYFPYGETWINNKANSEQTSSPYKFTAKEYDEETGLYYYGARYYDAKLSRWVSADPPLSRGDYLPVQPINDYAKRHNKSLPGIGGVFNTINIDAYNYSADNPVLFYDPDGNTLKTFMMRNWDKVLGLGLDSLEVGAGVAIVAGSDGIGTPLGYVIIIHGGTNAATKIMKMVYTSYIEEKYGQGKADQVDYELPDSASGMIFYACGQLSHEILGGRDDYGVPSKMGAAGDVLDVIIGIAVAGRGEQALLSELQIYQKNTKVSIDQLKVLKAALDRNKLNVASRWVQGIIEGLNNASSSKKSVDKLSK